MARKRYDDDVPQEHHERWLISYADLITLLFAFFVVMYAISIVNEGKYQVLSDALGDAFGGRGAATQVNTNVSRCCRCRTSSTASATRPRAASRSAWA